MTILWDHHGKPPAPVMRAASDHLDPAQCRGLFAAVLLRALRDAAGRCRDTGSPGSRDAFREAALAWFRGDGEWFRETCALAGVDPATVRRAVLADPLRVAIAAEGKGT